MKAMYAIYRKEIGHYFVSPVAYIIVGVFLLLSGYFFNKVLGDKTLGIDRQAKFVQPEDMRKGMMYDYQNLIEKTAPPGAEGANEGNGKANQYLDTSPPIVPTDSKLSPEEQKILKEANTTTKSSSQGSIKIQVTDAQKQEPKKKPSFFKRLFGGNKKDSN